MKHRVAELEGALLDAAVALADGRTPGKFGSRNFYLEDTDGVAICTVEPFEEGSERFIDGAWLYDPSTAWALGGPLIERERIGLDPESERWAAGYNYNPESRAYEGAWALGPTALIAAMRAFVCSKLGEEVELPNPKGEVTLRAANSTQENKG